MESEISEASLFAQARVLEAAWIKEDPTVRLPLTQQYPSPIRPYQALWLDSPTQETYVPPYPPCPRCQHGQFRKSQVTEGVRHNGDGYGRRYETCGQCGWTCWWKYDDA